eukprot:498964-Pleurochrysis_carterae.AAC.1
MEMPGGPRILSPLRNDLKGDASALTTEDIVAQKLVEVVKQTSGGSECVDPIKDSWACLAEESLVCRSLRNGQVRLALSLFLHDNRKTLTKRTNQVCVASLVWIAEHVATEVRFAICICVESTMRSREDYSAVMLRRFSFGVYVHERPVAATSLPCELAHVERPSVSSR